MPEPHTPIFVVGAPRSGTTLFYKCLCLHPDVSWISNWVARAPALPELAWLNRLPRRFPRLQDRVWFGDGGNAYVYGRRRPVLHRIVPMPVEGEPVFARAGLAGDSGGGRPDALRAAARRLVAASGGQQLVSKRIANNRRIPALLSAFPQARVLHVLRDGRDVARSLAEVDWWETSVVAWYGGTPAQWRGAGGDDAELRARTWIEELAAIDAGLAIVPADQQLAVRYEAALSDPGTVMDEVGAFAGLRADPRWRARAVTKLEARPHRAPAPGDASAERARIEALQAERLRALGYELTAG